MQIIKFLKKHPEIILTIVPIVVITIWFRDAKLIATGEDGLWLYEPRRTLNMFSSVWTSNGVGGVSIFKLPKIPVYTVTSFMSDVLPSWIIQVLLFFFIILSGTFGAYKLTNEIVAKNKHVSVVAGLFYFLNLYSQSQIWKRFSFHLIYFWGFLPLFTFFWIRWVKSGKSKWLILFLISTIVFSYSFGSPALVITAFSVIGTWSVVQIFRNLLGKRKRDTIFLLKRVFIGLFSFLLTNIWWLFPYLTLTSVSLSGVSSWEENFNSLRGVSTFFPTIQILLLRQNYLFGSRQDIFGFYSNPFIYAVSVGVLLIVIGGVVVNRKKKYWPYLMTLAVIGWFVSKGANPPFGYQTFKFLFSNVPQTMLLRNPYEKFGLVWVIPYSIFFSLGVSKILRSKETISKVISGLLVIASLVILVWPMWTGKLYSRDVHVMVPEYYKHANDFLNEDKSHSRLLMLPMIAGDGIQYEWEEGRYFGNEPSEYLFDKPSVSKISRSNKYADEKYRKLRETFLVDEIYTDILDEMNIKYLILHHDYAENIARQKEIEKMEKYLMENKEIKFIKNIGKLSIYAYIANSEPKHMVVEGDTIPEINFRKVSNSNFVVEVIDSIRPYTLVFKESFHERWEAEILNEKLGNHFMAYGYANGWRIDRTGSYTIDINFKVWPWE